MIVKRSGPQHMLTAMNSTAEPVDVVELLVGRYGLPDIAARACVEAGIPGREPAVAYCVAVLVFKRDRAWRGERRYGLDIGADDFVERLLFWAGEIARHMRRWGPEYEAIHEEATRYDVTTLRRFVRTHRDDDQVAEVASRLMVVIGGTPRLDDMSLTHLRAYPPAGNAYVFQVPLSAWIRTAGRRVVPVRGQDPIEWHVGSVTREDDETQGRFADVLEAERERAHELFDAGLESVADLAATRELLASAIKRADGWETALAGRADGHPDDAGLLAQLRAALLHVADGLRREQASVTGMLAFLLFAIRSAPAQQRIAILSLRLAMIDHAAIAELSRRMQELLADDRHPSPTLVRRTANADARVVPRSRLTALEELRDAETRRAELLAPVVAMLDALPEVVADNTEIAALAAGGNASRVKVHRSKAAAELTAVDPWFGAVFRRYAMGRPR